MPRWPPARASSRKEPWTSRRAVRAWWFAPIAAEYEVEHVLGADGANSIVRKKLARPFAPRASYRLPPAFSSMVRRRRRSRSQTMHEQPGYLWSFPRRDHLAVGVCAAAAHHASSGQLRAQSAAWIQEHGLHQGTRITPYSWPIPSIGYEADAEGDPGRRGMDAARRCRGPGGSSDARRYLLRAAVRAAGQPRPCSRRRGHARRRGTQTGCSAIIQPELARAAQLSTVFFTPAFSALLVRALDESAGIRDVFVDLVGGVQPYRGLRRRLLATREWSLAARAIRHAHPARIYWYNV